jgi:hypothetical protein
MILLESDSAARPTFLFHDYAHQPYNPSHKSPPCYTDFIWYAIGYTTNILPRVLIFLPALYFQSDIWLEVSLCGRFAQAQTREEYLAYLADEGDRDSAYYSEPIGRYNVTPGTKVLLLNERDEQLHLDPVLWSYAPGWWDKQPLINARVESAATRRMFKPLWEHGRAICIADGWFEWKKYGFAHRSDLNTVSQLA